MYACPPHESCAKGCLGRSFSGQAVCVFALLSCTSGNDAGWKMETRWRGEFGRGSDGVREAGLKLT